MNIVTVGRLLALLMLVTAATANASQDTLGPNGINALGLTTLNGVPLNGQGQDIGMAVCAVAAALPLSAPALAEPTDQRPDAEAITIPLDQIWAYDMPGTRDIQKFERHGHSELLEAIRRTLSTRPPQGKTARAGFAVVGDGPDALPDIHAVLVEGKKPRENFPPDSDLTLVFFSYQFGFYVHLHSVSLRGDFIEIQYRFVPHKTKEVTEHFALIPVGKLRPSKVQVDVLQLPMAQEFASAGWKPVNDDVVRRIVCQSFSFVVK
jgi:hypothetical protein